MGIEEERKPRGEVVHGETSLKRCLDIGNPVSQGEGQFLDSGWIPPREYDTR